MQPARAGSCRDPAMSDSGLDPGSDLKSLGSFKDPGPSALPRGRIRNGFPPNAQGIRLGIALEPYGSSSLCDNPMADAGQTKLCILLIVKRLRSCPVVKRVSLVTHVCFSARRHSEQHNSAKIAACSCDSCSNCCTQLLRDGPFLNL